MALDKFDNEETFADSDDEEMQPKKKKSKTMEVPHAGSLCIKQGRGQNSTLYYVDYNKTKNNGNGPDPTEHQELLSNVAKTENELTALKSSVQTATAKTVKLLSEPTNEVLAARLEKEEAELTALQEEVEAARKLIVNEKHKQQTKRRIDYMSAEWSKRRRICMGCLHSLEEISEGAISVKKCLSGNGPIDIDSDEAVAKAAVEYAKNKKNKKSKGSSLLSPKSAVLVGKKQSFNASGTLPPKPTGSGIQANEDFVALSLDSRGRLKRICLDEGDATNTTSH